MSSHRSHNPAQAIEHCRAKLRQAGWFTLASSLPSGRTLIVARRDGTKLTAHGATPLAAWLELEKRAAASEAE